MMKNTLTSGGESPEERAGLQLAGRMLVIVGAVRWGEWWLELSFPSVKPTGEEWE